MHPHPIERRPAPLHRHLYLGALFCLVGCAPLSTAQPETMAANDEGAIVGTTLADGERPEVVALDVEKEGRTFVCTGTLIGAHTVLTARHCVEGALDDRGCHITALVDRKGESSLGRSVERLPAAACLVMGTGTSFRTDLALVRLQDDVMGIVPARLATSTTPRGAYTVYGYGSFGRGLGVSCELPSDGHKRKAAYTGNLGLRFGQVTCKGDSGGPHFAGSSNVISGVTSGGAASLGVAVDMNVDVNATRAWIVEGLRSFGDSDGEP